jgi:formate hydrogenlyase subunit 5
MPERAADPPIQGKDLAQAVQERWRCPTTVGSDAKLCRIDCERPTLAALCHWLVTTAGYVFATLVVEEQPAELRLTYVFHRAEGDGWAHLELHSDPSLRSVPSISHAVVAADWHEREAEDLFGIVFEGHPGLGEFVLHEEWPEGINPMRRSFDARQRLEMREADPRWDAPTIVEAPGAFAMPIGPVFSDTAESAHFLLETVGEDVIRTITRFFYKYRGVEKIAEGQGADRALLLAERFSGSSAFAHGLAFCQAAEAICGVAVPPRAEALRTLWAELERLRHHAAAITGICGSTALAVAQSLAAIIEEELLRLCGDIAGHRYLFGVLKLGGVSFDLDDAGARRLKAHVDASSTQLAALERSLRYSSSFLDRLEEVGAVTRAEAESYALVGPVARASGLARDMRKLFPYAAYGRIGFDVPVEPQGDGYARLRILFREIAQSASIIGRVLADLPAGPVLAPVAFRAGHALAAVEAPIGAAFHWLALDEGGRVARYRIAPPSFANWHGFHLAAENFAFQDFPIILASFGLSIAESDR